jgi:hypothetical protein
MSYTTYFWIEFGLKKGRQRSSIFLPNSRKSSAQRSAEEQSRLHYVLFGESHESAGSLVWTGQQLLSGRLYDTEGIWFPARLWIFQLGQILVAGFVCAMTPMFQKGVPRLSIS